MMKQHEYIFGPVPSRRLGLSLGVDIIPYKTCTYDCIYCQLGATTLKTAERKEYAPIDKIIGELEIRLKSSSRPDYVTVSGSGEPTLHSGIGELINAIKHITDIPVAVLTNGSLLYLKEVRDALMNADLVLPSLDAGDEAMFETVNCPYPGIGFREMTEGIKRFCKEFKGRTWLEVFLMDGVNDNEDDIRKIISETENIKPDRVQLNTCDRPACSHDVSLVCRERLEEIAGLFAHDAEIIAHIPMRPSVCLYDYRHVEAEIMGILKRRPCRLTDLCLSTGITPNEVVKMTGRLIKNGRISTEVSGNELFFRYNGKE